jgi:lipoprotein NlpI
MKRTALALLLAVAAVLGAGVPAVAQNLQAVLDKAVADFEAGRVVDSATGFDTVVQAAPLLAPRLWQRGVTLFYAGRFADCKSQMEATMRVSPDDVENAAWHYMCVARLESPARARASLLPVQLDTRVPMKEIYEMLRGTMTPDAVVKAAGATPAGQFYANFYAGLYYDVNGDRTRALPAMTTAAMDRYAMAGGYMHAAARIHLARLRGGR